MRFRSLYVAALFLALPLLSQSAPALAHPACFHGNCYAYKSAMWKMAQRIARLYPLYVKYKAQDPQRRHRNMTRLEIWIEDDSRCTYTPELFCPGLAADIGLLAFQFDVDPSGIKHDLNLDVYESVAFDLQEAAQWLGSAACAAGNVRNAGYRCDAKNTADVNIGYFWEYMTNAWADLKALPCHPSSSYAVQPRTSP